MAKPGMLFKWLHSDVIERNIKNTFSATLNTLYNVCLLDTSHRSLCDSLYDILYKDTDFRKKSQAHTTIFGWFEDENTRTTHKSSPEAQQNFSFTENEQEAVVEKFVAKQYPPVSTDFNNVDLMCMPNFLI
ncbi:36756_t:CDS:2, partial [Racocetra persica]